VQEHHCIWSHAKFIQPFVRSYQVNQPSLLENFQKNEKIALAN